MGTACCVTIPRDIVSRVAVLITLFCLLLQVIVVFDAANDSRNVRWLHVSTPNGTFAVTPWAIMPTSEHGKSSPLTLCPVSVGGNATLEGKCDDLVKAGRGAVGMSLLSIFLGVFGLALLTYYTANKAAKNTPVYGVHFAVLTLPLLTQLIALFVVGVTMFNRTTAVFDEIPVASTTTWSHGGGLLVAVVIFQAVTWFALLTRLFIYRLTASSVKQKANTDELLAIRVVNDDWTRQKDMWLERRRAVTSVLGARHLNSRESRMAMARTRGVDHSFFFQQKFIVRDPFTAEQKRQPTPLPEMAPKPATPKSEEPVEPAAPEPTLYRPVFGIQVVEHAGRLKIHGSTSEHLKNNDIIATINNSTVHTQAALQECFAGFADAFNALPEEEQEAARTSMTVRFVVRRKEAKHGEDVEEVKDRSTENPTVDQEGFASIEVEVRPEWVAIKKKKKDKK